MNDNEIRDAVFAILRGIAPEVDPGTLSGDRPLRDQIDLDSMDWLNFIVALHRRLRVEIPEADYGKLGTLDELVGYLVRRTAS